MNKTAMFMEIFLDIRQSMMVLRSLFSLTGPLIKEGTHTQSLSESQLCWDVFIIIYHDEQPFFADTTEWTHMRAFQRSLQSYTLAVTVMAFDKESFLFSLTIGQCIFSCYILD
jgi:hypothetical protein